MNSRSSTSKLPMVKIVKKILVVIVCIFTSTSGPLRASEWTEYQPITDDQRSAVYFSQHVNEYAPKAFTVYWKLKSLYNQPVDVEIVFVKADGKTETCRERLNPGEEKKDPGSWTTSRIVSATAKVQAVASSPPKMQVFPKKSGAPSVVPSPSPSPSPQQRGGQVFPRNGISETTRRQNFTVGGATWEHTLSITGSVLEVASKENGESAYSRVDLADHRIIKARASFYHGSGADEEWVVEIYLDHSDTIYIHFNSEKDAVRAEKEIQALIDARGGPVGNASTYPQASPSQAPSANRASVPSEEEITRFANLLTRLSKQNDTYGCLHEAQKMIAAFPTFGFAWRESAIARRNSGDLKGAYADATKALSLDPCDTSYSQMAYTLRDMGRMREALAMLDKAIAVVTNQRRLDIYKELREIWVSKMR